MSDTLATPLSRLSARLSSRMTGWKSLVSSDEETRAGISAMPPSATVPSLETSNVCWKIRQFLSLGLRLPPKQKLPRL